MRPYEVMIILDAAADDDVVAGIANRATEVITAAGGNIVKTDRLGRRRFAYELAKRWEGFYLLIEFAVDPTAVKELDRQLGLADEVLRHKVVRLPEHIAGTQKPASSTSSEDEAASTGATA